MEAIMSDTVFIFNPTYLYVKKHLVTGKLYFGKTLRNPLKYKGSGVAWQKHLKKHGNKVETIWYCLYTDLSTLEEAAISFSHLWDIVGNDQWMNMVIENGQNSNEYAGLLGAAVTANSYWVNNALVEKMIRKTETVPDGFTKGRLASTKKGKSNVSAKNTIWWNNGITQTMSKTRPGADFIPGRLGVTNKHKTIQKEKDSLEYYKNPKLCIVCNLAIPYEKKGHKTCSDMCNTKNRSERRRLFWFLRSESNKDYSKGQS
jgi:hypothetical protein